MKFIGVKKDDEWTNSEEPALKQLHAMGYEYKTQDELNRDRRDYREVLLYDRLEKAVRKLNPELDDDGVYDSLTQINENYYPYSLDVMDTNEKIRAKLVGLSRSGGLEPITVSQNLGEGNVDKTVRLFDFDNPENNHFLVTNQFKMDGLKEPVYPDIVCYVNGIPLVVIECKSPYIKDPINQAVEKNFARYQSRGAGYERLMFYNHFLVATCGEVARHGTIGSSVNHYGRWSEPYPLTLDDVEKICKIKPREQEILIAGMLSKSHILDLLKNFIIYEVVNNKKVKKLAKHQQYRVVTRAIERLNLKNDISDKGGVVWHTQGSGKSLSMLWLATQLMYKFGNPPIVIVTDRRQLDEQIHVTFKECGFPSPIRAKSTRHLEELLKSPSGKTIMTLIQKFGTPLNHIHTKEKIIALVDEAHRTQYRFNAEAMRSAMPNAVFFAFSGTPIDKKDKSTYRVFGPLLDKYSFEESKEDGATLPIYYEERLPRLFIEGEDTIDQIFDRIFSNLDAEKKQKLKQQYATKEKIAEAPARISAICKNLVEHYEGYIGKNEYKAMLVTSSRDAAVTYKKELDRIDGPMSKIIMTSNLGEYGKDGTSWDKYYLTIQQREDEAEKFKSPEDQTKILIVVDMLLVGYDVPIVQVMYLDKELREHSLLQAIARVNRPYDKAKTHGLIVDYYGITKNLRKALAMFYEEDIKGALTPIEKLLDDLKLRHREAMIFFDDIDRNGPELKVNEKIIQKFEPVALRDGFEYAFKMFSKALDAVLPAKEAEPFINDFKFLSEKRFLIRNEYEGVGTSLRVEGKKVQDLIDRHLRSTNVFRLIPEKEITSANFLKYVLSKYKTEKARTALIKNKTRQVISELAPHNPVFFEKLRERLEKIIQQEERRRNMEAQDFDEKAYFDKLKEIYEQAISEERELKKLGFSTKFEFAVYQELLQVEKDKKISSNITNDIYKDIQEETKIVDWKNKTSSAKNMNIAIYDILSKNKIPETKIENLSSEIIELARRNL